MFDESGHLIPELKELAPRGTRRMSANPHANGGLIRRSLRLPDFRDYAIEVKESGRVAAENTRPLARFLRDIVRENPHSFRVFSPDENTSNKLDAIYEASKKLWLADYLPEDADGGELAPDGRVLEMLSEHTLEGWLEGYLLTGRHGFFSTYEAFVHVIDSMFNMHAKWLASSLEQKWRAPISSLNLLITSTVWRQDHNGFTHQDPGFLDVVVNKSPSICRIYLPLPDEYQHAAQQRSPNHFPRLQRGRRQSSATSMLTSSSPDGLARQEAPSAVHGNSWNKPSCTAPRA